MKKPRFFVNLHKTFPKSSYNIHKNLRNTCKSKNPVVKYYQIERQLHRGFTYDVLLVMQARSGENEEDRKVQISCICIAFSVGNSFHWIFFCVKFSDAHQVFRYHIFWPDIRTLYFTHLQ